MDRRSALMAMGGGAGLMALEAGNIANAQTGTEFGPVAGAGVPNNPKATIAALAGGVDVRQYGAAGDGGSDDTAAIRRAIAKAAGKGGVVFFPPGVYSVSWLEPSSASAWHGIAGASILKQRSKSPLLRLRGRNHVSFNGLVFEGRGGRDLNDKGLLVVEGASGGVSFEQCHVRDALGDGLVIRDSMATVRDCVFERIGDFGIIVNSKLEVRLLFNTLREIGNNGIRIQRSRPEDTRTLVIGNSIDKVRAVSGGDGPYGNGINIFRAHNVLVEGNHITNCAFSAIRSNLGHGCRYIGNHCANSGEVMLYIELGASEAVLMGNHLTNSGSSAISITNFNRGGRLATCTGNIIVNSGGSGIKVEADSIVQGNIIDGAPTGIIAGFGRFVRNVNIDGNIIQDTRAPEKKKLQYDILITNDPKAGKVFATNNRIFDFREKAIYGRNRKRPEPLGRNVYLANNYPGLASGDVPAAALGGSVNYEPDTGMQKWFSAGRRNPGWRRM